MKLALLSAAFALGLAAQAEAATIYYTPTPIAGSASVQTSSSGDATSPFSDNTPFLVVLGGGSATFAGSDFGGSDPANGTFSFFYGTPDTYNKLTFDTGGAGTSFSGFDISPPANGQGAGALVTLTGIGAYSTVTFSSSQNSFEFAAVSPVPLPASLPMFGAALIAVAGVSYGLNRRTAMRAKSVATAA